MSYQKTVLIFGAGSVGRGFLGDLCTKSDYMCWFVDTDNDLVSQLENARQYTIKIVCGNATERVVSPVRAIHASDIESIVSVIEEVELICTAAGSTALQHLAVPIALGLTQRMKAGGSPVNILVCENLPNAEILLKNYTQKLISQEYSDSLSVNAGFVRTVIGRMTPYSPENRILGDKLDITTEDYSVLPVDAAELVAPLPPIGGFQPVSNFDSMIAQKLFLHNCPHAMLAYLGSQVKIDTIADVMLRSDIREIVVNAMNDVVSALSAEYNLHSDLLYNYQSSLLSRFACSDLGDTCKRVGRDPIRKLRPNDRLVGCARMLERQGISPKFISVGIAAALTYSDPTDESSIILQQMIEDKGIYHTLWNICGVSPEERLGQMILESMKKLPQY